jgi:hypothetical protein
MSNTAPFEVIAAPFDVYLAPTGTAFPDVDEDPAVDWVLVGTSGNLNYDRQAGVTVEHRQATSPWRSVGDCGVRKNFRTEEDLIIRFTLVDMTIEQYAIALNHNTVTDEAAASGVPGYRWAGLSRGTQITTKAMLIRGAVSPYATAMNMQYEVPLVQQIGSAQVTLALPGQPAGLALEFMALVDTSAATEAERFGRIVAQDAAPGA